VKFNYQSKGMKTFPANGGEGLKGIKKPNKEKASLKTKQGVKRLVLLQPLMLELYPCSIN